VFELYDRHRREVLAISDTKKGAVHIAAQVLKEQPRRILRDFVIRARIEPPVRIYYLKGFKPPSEK
jgi:hypothetical protein|tara:strand:+ start:302 stop:499 length:198 start_codon:yes stop_codon:yes gene_type:complete